MNAPNTVKTISSATPYVGRQIGPDFPSRLKEQLVARGFTEAQITAVFHAAHDAADPVQAAPEPEPEPQIGDVMPNGTIYAGISPTTGTRMFAMPNDAPKLMPWEKAASYAFNLNAHCHQGSRQRTEKDLEEAGSDDGGWRLPTKAELVQLHRNKDAGALKGTFNENSSATAHWYWSCTQPREDASLVYAVAFTDGGDVWVRKDNLSLSGRVVRAEPRP